MNDLLWWEKLTENNKYLFSFLFIDRVGSTKEKEHYTPPEVKERAETFRRIVNEKIISFNGKNIEWHGDSTLGFFHESTPDSLLERARILAKKSVECALAIFGELIIHEELKGYMAVHIGELPFKKQMGEINSHDLNIGGHALKVCPKAGILLHEEVYKLLPDDLRGKFRYLGTTKDDNIPLFVYPKQREIDERRKDDFVPAEKDSFKAKEEFLKFIKRRYGVLIPRGLRQERILSIDLFKVYSPLKVRKREEREIFRMEEPGQQQDKTKTPFIRETVSSPPVSVPELLRKSRQTVILGPPGAGKSTLISWLALSTSEGKISAKERLKLDEALLPLPVSIGQLSQIRKAHNNNIGMFDAIIQYFNIHEVDVSSFLKEELERGNAFVLLDGMDEVQSDIERREISRWIEAFMQRYTENRFVITSRVIGFPGISLRGGEVTQIEELTIEEAKPLIEKWMIAIEQQQRGENEFAEKSGREEAEKLIATLEKVPQLSRFFANPFLLTLTVLIHKTEARLPNYRIQLYERMIQTLVETWQQARSIGIKQPEEQRMDFRTEAIPVLAPLALYMHENFPAGTLPEKDFRDFIKKRLKETGSYGVSDPEIEKSTEALLKKLKEHSGLLEEKGREVWGFTHLSFEEYLSAVEIVRNDDYKKYLDKYRYDSRWEEVFILVASELGITQCNTKKVTEFIENIFRGQGDNIREDILKKHIFLAGRCIANSANIEVKLTDEIISTLIDFYFKEKVVPQYRAAKALNELMHLQKVSEKVKENILLKLEDKSKAVRSYAINDIAALDIQEEWAMVAVKEGLKDKKQRVRRSAIYAIAGLSIQEEWAVAAIKEGLKHKSGWGRGRSIKAIVQMDIKEDWAMAAVKEGFKDKDKWVKNSAISAIAVLGIQEEWAMKALKEGLKDEYGYVRGSTIEAIAAVGIKEEWTVAVVKEGLKDKDGWVRRSAINAIAVLGIQEEWAMKALKERLKDKVDSVRSSAIDVIAKMGIKEDWAIDALNEELNEKNSFAFVRNSTIDAIAALDIQEDWAMKAVMTGLKDPNTRDSAYEALWALTD